MRQLLLLTLFAVFLAGCGKPPYQNLDNARLESELAKGVAIYDIRRPEEWRQTGIVAGSRLLTFVDQRGQLRPDFLPRFSQEVAKDEPVILICRTGNRSSVLAKHLMEQMGYTQVLNVADGITDWIRAGKPVVKIRG